ncbi:flagellar hook-length control protein FliK [Ectothiorhodospira shaposhnikovii]|uniref:flagellar hook-length control protein FliK n=1 Tax=Ectothiorhodospira shaposhnikovii TaxID=1054 RepID=UPI001EE9A56E|nr:flagellar hook-length control protein FliK [Ectothiorhodospira shaposhnikovii]MCG5514206.1 flagellar hook-length control protein FliK [Ectothiorhodospira shaposhnikovii]
MNMSFMPFSALNALPALGGDSRSPVAALTGEGADFHLSLLGQLQQLTGGHPDPMQSVALDALLAQDPTAMIFPPDWLARLMDEAGITLEDLRQEGDDTAMASLLAAWQQLAETGRGLPGIAGESFNPGGDRRPEGGGLTALTAALTQVLHGQQGAGAAQQDGSPIMPQALHALVARLGGEGGRDAAAPLAPTSAETLPAGQAQPHSPTQPLPLRALDVDVPMSRPNWGQAVGSRVLWMVNQNMQGAELRLSPPHLGPLEVRITMEGDRANIQFLAHHPQAREALDAAMPRLREMFADSGVQLGDVDVSGREAGGQDEMARDEAGLRPDDPDGVDPRVAGDGTAGAADPNGTGLLDAYA